MCEGEAVGVEELSRELAEGLGPVTRGSRAVEGVTEDGSSLVGEVDADLVSASGKEAHFDEGEAREALEDAVEGDGLARSVYPGGKTLALAGVSSIAGLNAPFVLRKGALDQSEVAPVKALGVAVLEESGESLVGGVVFGHDEKS